MHDHGGEDADAGINEQAGKARYGELGQVDGFLEGLEALLHVVNAQEEKAEPGEYVAQALGRLGILEGQDEAEDQHGHGIGRDIDLEPEAGDEPGAGGGAQVGAKDDADAGGEANQSGAEEGDGDDGHQGTGLHDAGGDDAKGHALPQPVGRALEDFLQDAAGEGLEAVFQKEHPKQEDGDTSRDLLEVRADPKAICQDGEDDGEDDFSQHGGLPSAW